MLSKDKIYELLDKKIIINKGVAVIDGHSNPFIFPAKLHNGIYRLRIIRVKPLKVYLIKENNLKANLDDIDETLVDKISAKEVLDITLPVYKKCVDALSYNVAKVFSKTFKGKYINVFTISTNGLDIGVGVDFKIK